MSVALAPLIEEMLNLILEQKPDVVGFSMIFSDQLPIRALLGKLIRREQQVSLDVLGEAKELQSAAGGKEH